MFKRRAFLPLTLRGDSKREREREEDGGKKPMMIMTTIDATPPSAITPRGGQERVRRKRGRVRMHEILDETCIMGGRLLSYLTSDGNRFAPTPSFALGRGSAHSRVTGIELDFLSRCYILLLRLRQPDSDPFLRDISSLPRPFPAVTKA